MINTVSYWNDSYNLNHFAYNKFVTICTSDPPAEIDCRRGQTTFSPHSNLGPICLAATSALFRKDPSSIPRFAFHYRPTILATASHLLPTESERGSEGGNPFCAHNRSHLGREGRKGRRACACSYTRTAHTARHTKGRPPARPAGRFQGSFIAWVWRGSVSFRATGSNMGRYGHHQQQRSEKCFYIVD